MLEWKSQEKAITQEEEGACKREIKAIQKELAALQQPIKQAGLPVLLIFEGWSASGKGSIISKVISELDPRGYQVWSYADPTDEEGRRPLLWSFWRDLPPRGEMAVLDRSWYSRALTRLEEDRAAASGLVESINTFERQLGDDGYLILKFFLNLFHFSLHFLMHGIPFVSPVLGRFGFSLTSQTRKRVLDLFLNIFF